MLDSQDKIKEIVQQVVKQLSDTSENKEVDHEKMTVTVPIGVSARHIHISEEHFAILYGKEATLTQFKGLMGGQFAAKERVTLVGTNLRVIENVRILGPCRSKTQVELAKTDAFKLGVLAPVRSSGDIVGTPGITIVGPKGSVTLEEGCIVAKRHIHMNTEDAMKMEFVDKQIVSVVSDGEREGVLRNVEIRVDPTFDLEMHIDTDEANALGIKCGGTAKILR